LRILSLVALCGVTLFHRLVNLPHHPRSLNHDSFQLSSDISAVCDKHKQLCTLILPKIPFQVTHDACSSPVANTQQIYHYVLSLFAPPPPHVIFIFSYLDGLRNIFYLTRGITVKLVYKSCIIFWPQLTWIFKKTQILYRVI
jgi:hypothetical protein